MSQSGEVNGCSRGISLHIAQLSVKRSNNNYGKHAGVQVLADLTDIFQRNQFNFDCVSLYCLLWHKYHCDVPSAELLNWLNYFSAKIDRLPRIAS